MESRHYDNRSGWQLDDNWSLTILTPDTLTAIDLDSRVVSVSREMSHRNAESNIKIASVMNSIYCECTMLWCGTLADQPRTRTIGDIIDAEDSVVTFDSESNTIYATTGESKYTVKFDSDLDYAVTEYTITQPDACIEYVCSEFFQPFDAVWLPKKVSRIVTLAAKPGISEEIQRVDATIQKISFNSVTEDDFRYTPPPGCVVVDEQTAEKCIVPGGLGFFIEKVDALCLYGYGKFRRFAGATSQYAILAAVVFMLPSAGGVYALLRRCEQPVEQVLSLEKICSVKTHNVDTENDPERLENP